MANFLRLASRPVALALGVAAAAHDPSFDAHLAGAGLNFTGPEYRARRELYHKAVDEVRAQNSAPDALWEAELNEFATLTEEERRLTLTGYRRVPGDNEGGDGDSEESTGSGPALRELLHVRRHWDWRDHRPNVVTPVKRQGRCASCWAFAATAALESALALETGALVDLSPQQIASCTPNKHKCGGEGGCNGGVAWLAFEYAKRHGVASAWAYPFVDHDAKDTAKSTTKCFPLAPGGTRRPVAGVTGYTRLPHNREESLVAAVLRTPVAVTVDSAPMLKYKRGIFNSCSKDAHIDHIVVLMGFGSDRGHDYWLVRNSWGVQWGEAGYIRLLRRPGQEPCGYSNDPWWGYSCEDHLPDKVKVCGMCGILSDSSYPLGAHLIA